MSFILECILEGIGMCLCWCCVKICNSECINSNQRSNQNLPPSSNQQETFSDASQIPGPYPAYCTTNRNLVTGMG